MLMRVATAFTLLTLCVSAHAGLVIQGSRIIYDEARGEVTVQMQYVGDTPMLLQLWLERQTHSDTGPGEQEVPFIVTPAVTRMDPGNGQTVRILRTGDGLPGAVYRLGSRSAPASSMMLEACRCISSRWRAMGC